MNQDPTMQGGTTPNPGSQPTGAANPPSATPTSPTANAAATSTGSTPSASVAPTANATSPAGTDNNNNGLPNWMNSVPDPVVTGLPNGSVVDPATPPKKKYTGLIITLVIVFILLLAGVGVAVWYFCFYSNPENVAFEAVSNFLHEKSLTVTGNMTMSSEHSDGHKSATSLTLSNSSVGAAGTSELGFKTTTIEDGEETTIELSLGTVAISDGTVYLKISNITDILDQYLETEEITDETASEVMRLIKEIFEKIDGQWWRISVPDFLDKIAPSAEEAKPVKDLYACVVDVMNQDIKGELADIYRDNRFLVIDKVSQATAHDIKPQFGNSLYTIDYNYEAMANFLNALPNSAIANKAYDCYNTFVDTQNPQDYLDDYDVEVDIPEHISASDFEKITAKDLEDERDPDSNAKQYIEVTNFGHQLKGIYAYYDESETYDGGYVTDDDDFWSSTDSKPLTVSKSGLMQLNFSYATVTVSEPENYRPIEDLVEDIVNLFTQFVTDLYSALGGIYGYGYDYDWSVDDTHPDDWVFDYDYGYWYNPDDPSEHTSLPMNGYDFSLDQEA